MKSALIAGYYGFGNSGDEAILRAMIQDLRPQLEPVVLSGDPDGTARLHGVRAIAWSDLDGILREAARCDLVILGGGGLLHDTWGIDPVTILTPEHSGITFYVSLAVLAALYGKPLMLYAVGVGPLKDEVSRFYTQAIAAQADLISVRDRPSRELLEALGVDGGKLHLTADAAFGLEAAPLRRPLQGLGPEEAPTLGIALRNWDVGVAPETWEREVAVALDAFLETHPGRAVFLPCQESDDAFLDDRAVARRVQSAMRHADRTVLIEGLIDPAEQAGLLARCRVVLGMRLHALILALNGGVPMVGLAYDPKVESILGQAGLADYCLGLTGLSGAALCASMTRALHESDALAARIRTARIERARQARENAVLARGLLDSSAPRGAADHLVAGLRRLIESHRDQARRMQAAIRSRDDRIRQDDQTLLEQRQSLAEQTAALAEKSAAVSALETRLADLERRGAEQSRAIEGARLRLAEKESVLAALERRALEQDRSIRFLDSELASIKGSRGWKVLWGLWQLRLSLIPRGSWREGLLRKLWRAADRGPAGTIRQAGRRLARSASPGMSAFAFAFDLFKRRRQRGFHPDLSSLRVPAETGLVSVVMPVYNGAAYLAEALDSVLNQTYTRFELIAVDDGSRDASAAILDRYARRDPRLRVIHQENRKLPRALNRGFELARGQYLTWTSHDNRMQPDFLERMVRCLERHPAWDMAYANLDLIGADGGPLPGSDWFGGYQRPPGSPHVFLPEDTAELNTYANNFVGAAFLYRDRVPWLIGSYNPRQYTREDYDYWMRVNELLTLRHADFRTPVYDYRFHGDSLTQRDAELGITRDRPQLMILDDFRRDLSLSPLLWIVDDEVLPEQLFDAAPALRAWIARAGHVLVRASELRVCRLPRLWMPSVYLKLVEDPAAIGGPPELLPAGALKAVLCTSAENLPGAVHAAWDLCLARGAASPAEPLTGDRRGWLVAPDLAALLTAVDIRARARQAEAVEREMTEAPGPGFKISVVICTYRRGARLRDTLVSAARQTLPQAEYEVILVNNEPGDPDPAALVDELHGRDIAAGPDHLRLVDCPLPGLSHARNAGIAEARGELLLFLDDDAVARDDLLEQYVRAFAGQAEAGVIGGHVKLERPPELSIPWKDGWERYWSEFVTGHREYSAVQDWWEFPWGANWCARRRALVQVGGFRTQYGRRGRDFWGGEELVAASLIRKAGYEVAVLPSAVVAHRVDPDRFTLEHLKRTIRAGLFARYQAQIDLYLPPEEGAGGSLRTLACHATRWLAALRPGYPDSRAALIEARFYLSARWLLLLRQLSDGFRRMRRPVTARPVGRRA